MKQMTDNHSNTQMNLYILQFINYLHQYHRAIEAIVPLFVRKIFIQIFLLFSFFEFLALSG